MIKLFLELEFLAFWVWFVGACIDWSHRTTTGYSDDGWTQHYTIPRNIRALTTNMTKTAGVIAGLGCLVILVWLSIQIWHLAP